MTFMGYMHVSHSSKITVGNLASEFSLSLTFIIIRRILYFVLFLLLEKYTYQSRSVTVNTLCVLKEKKSKKIH